MKIRQLSAATALLLAATVPAATHAQDYPSRPIRIIVPFTPGTAADTFARLLGPQISQRWGGVPIVVDNRSGAAGIIGIEAAANANADGHTFLFMATAFGTLAAMNPKLPYDPYRSFSPVMMLGASPLALVVANKFPATSVRELIEQARKQPGAINYASSGTGSVFHLTMEWFKQENGVNLVHVPYKGTAGVTADIIAGQVQASLMVFQTITPHVQAGRVRMLAVLGRDRMPQFPQVPTLAESGMPGMVVEAWTGVMAPAKTPQSAINKLNAEINGLLALPENRETLTKLGIRVIGGKPDALDQQVRGEIKRWTEVVKRGNIATN
ncbi:MAG: Bug family tripartite tricarboxylate transporter substrate binding protein [Burkholderiales bacterium]